MKTLSYRITFFLLSFLVLFAQVGVPTRALATVIDSYREHLGSDGLRSSPDNPFARLSPELSSQLTRKHIDAAGRHYEAGNLTQAVQELEKAAELGPQVMSIQLALGELYNRTGRYEAAIEAANTVLKSVPQSAQPHDIIGTAYLKLNKPQFAIKAYEQVVRRVPDMAIGYHHLGDAYWAQGKNRQALEQYDEALKREPRQVDVMLKSAAVLQELGQAQKAIRLAKEALGIDSKSPLAYAILGDSQLAAHEYGGAVEAYTTAIRLAPNFSYLYERLGFTYAKQNEVEKAMQAYQQLVSRNPRSLVGQEQLAVLYAKQNQPARKEYHLGVAAFLRGQSTEAIRHYKAAIHHDPKLSGAYVDMAAIYLRENPAAAAAMASKAVQFAPRDPIALNLLGRAETIMGRNSDAEIHLKAAIEADATYAPAYISLADFLETQHRCAEALGYYERASTLTPDKPTSELPGFKRCLKAIEKGR